MDNENGVSDVRTKEYDEFGPWIVDIPEPDMMPALFKPFYHETEDPLMLFKIPRKIERRAASPLMDLYDYVIGAFGEYLYILKRNGKKVSEKKVTCHKIAAVKRTHDILKGELTLFLPDELICIAYNTVSDDIILNLICIIQEKQAGSEITPLLMESLPVEYEPQKKSSLDLYYVNLCKKLNSIYPELRLKVYQPGISIGRYPAKFFQRLLFKKVRMTRSAFMSDGRTLVVIGSDMTARIRSVDKLAYYYLFIGIAGISDAQITDFNMKRRLKKLEIYAARYTFEFIYDSANERMDQLAAQLRAKRIR